MLELCWISQHPRDTYSHFGIILVIDTSLTPDSEWPEVEKESHHLQVWWEISDLDMLNSSLMQVLEVIFEHECREPW